MTFTTFTTLFVLGSIAGAFLWSIATRGLWFTIKALFLGIVGYFVFVAVRTGSVVRRAHYQRAKPARTRHEDDDETSFSYTDDNDDDEDWRRVQTGAATWEYRDDEYIYIRPRH